MKSSADYLNEAAAIQEQRGRDYDAPTGERSMGAIVEAFNAIYGTNLTETQGWQFLVLLKMRRLHTAKGHHEDSAADEVSYAALAAESSERNQG